MEEVYLNFSTFYVPKGKVSNNDLSERFPEWSIHKIGEKTGISNRHITSKNEFASDLAIESAKKLFEKENINKDDIDYLIYCTQSPDYFLPTTACILQNQLGLPKNIGAIDINQGCSGYIYGLSLAKGLVQSKIAKNVLFITSETYSKFIHPKDKKNLSIFGDGATSTIISGNKIGFQIGKFIFGTDGSGFEDLIVRNGAIRNEITKENNIEPDSYGNIDSPNHLYMNGQNIFKFVNTVTPSFIQRVLEENSLKKEEISLFIFHQANKFMLEHLRKKLKIDEEKFIIDLDNYGNTVSSTIPIALNPFFRKTNKDIDYVLLYGFGVGLSMGSVVLKKV